MIQELILGGAFNHLRSYEEKEQEIQNYLTAQNLKAVQDSVGQDHRGRNVLSEGLTQKVGLDSVRQECALCCQGKVH